MSAIHSKVAFEGVARQPNGNVKGKVALVVYGDWNGDDFEHKVESKDFDFAKGGNQTVAEFEIPFTIKIVSGKLKLSAIVHEENEGQCCIKGHAHFTPEVPPVGGGIGEDITTDNCTAIPAT